MRRHRWGRAGSLEIVQSVRSTPPTILESRELKRQRAKTLNRGLAFLELEPWDWSQADLSDVCVSEPVPPLPPRASDFLHAFYAPSNRWLQELLDPSPNWAATSLRDSAAA